MHYYLLHQIPNSANISAIIAEVKSGLQEGMVGVDFSALQDMACNTLVLAFLLEVKRAFPQVIFHSFPERLQALIVLYGLEALFPFDKRTESKA